MTVLVVLLIVGGVVAGVATWSAMLALDRRVQTNTAEIQNLRKVVQSTPLGGGQVLTMMTAAPSFGTTSSVAPRELSDDEVERMAAWELAAPVYEKRMRAALDEYRATHDWRNPSEELLVRLTDEWDGMTREWDGVSGE